MPDRIKPSYLFSTAFVFIAIPAVLVFLGAKPAQRVARVPRGAGGQVHGYVVARVLTPPGAPSAYIRLPNATVFLKRLPAGAVAATSKVVTNPHGYFIVPNQPPGSYQLCTQANGFIPDCDPKTVTITQGTFVLDHDLMIAPKGGFLRGRVLLHDGQVCYQESQFFRTLVTTQVSLLGSGGHFATEKVVAGPVLANSMGFYVLPGIAQPGSYTLKATCAAGEVVSNAVLASKDVGGAAPFDLAFANSAPRIRTVLATLAGKPVRRASPGDVLKVVAKVEDADGNPVHFKWADGSPGFHSVDAPTIEWPLPKMPGYRLISVEVTDGKGGFARAQASVATGVEGQFFAGVVFDRTSHAPIAGAAISVNGTAATTGRNGAFTATVADADRYVVNVRAPQYALLSQVYYDGVTGMNLALDRVRRVSCLPNQSCEAGDETKRCGSFVVIDPGTLVDGKGKPASQPVFVDIHNFDLTQANAIPGDYGALLKTGRAAVMESFGAVDVAISDSAGNRLNLAAGKTAEIDIGIDPGELAKAPPSIALFSYDEKTGMWREEGTAQKQGNVYRGRVSHFTSWNADSVFSGTACIAVHVQDVDSTHGAPSLPFRLHGDIPSSPGLFRHPDFTVTSAPFALFRLPPNVSVNIEVHTNSGPDFPPPLTTFTVNSGAAINPIYEAPPFNGIPPLNAIDTACNGAVTITLPLPVHDVPWLNVPSPPCTDVRNASCANETTAYFKAVGALDAGGNPTAARGTFNAWKTTNHLSTDPTHPAAGEVEAIFYNNGDLQLGRDMHCIKTGNNVACYVSNYSSTLLPGGPDQDAIHLAEASNRVPLASVAMEYDLTLGINAVRFYVFHADLPNNDGTLFPNPALDSELNKYTPWLCQACHGGAYNTTTHNVENAAFLPFDVPSYKQDLVLTSPFSEPNQREAFGQLNALVAATAPNSTNPNDPIRNLITQWYQWCGGAGAPGCTIDDAAHPYLPPPPSPGWTGHADLYQKIPRVYCRTCHVAQGSASSIYPDWTQFSDFNSPSVLRSAVCTGRSMPHSEVSFRALWLSADPHGPAYLADPVTGIGITPGCPP